MTLDPAPSPPGSSPLAPPAIIDTHSLDALREAIGADRVTTVEDQGEARVVASPGSTAEVAAVLKVCAGLGIGVVPQGGRTGLVGGEIASAGEIVLSSARLNRILELDPVARVAVVEAGVTLEALQEAARPHRLEPGIDIPSRGSATIGGMISTNAGGIMAFRYGVMRHQVLGLEAVLPDGSIYSDLSRVVKNTAGYDLKHLFIGAEGTLGIVTRVVLKLEIAPIASVTAFFGLPSVAAVLDLIRLGLDSPAGMLRAAETLWHDYFRLTSTVHGFADPSVDPSMPLYLLLELGGPDESAMRAAFEQIFASALDRYPNMCGVIAASARQERDLWRLREDTDAIYGVFPAAPSFDVSLPLSSVEAYVANAVRELKLVDPVLQPFVFGHLADGNLHIVLNHAGPMPAETAQRVEATLYGPLRSCGGSLSAEHGIGSKRVHALRAYSDPARLSLMRAVRGLIAGVSPSLNRGKVLD